MTTPRILLITAFGVLAPLSAGAKPTDQAAYEQKLEARVQNIVAALNLDDAAKQTRVHDALLAQYRDLNAWHERCDSQLKTANRAAGSKDPAEAAAGRERRAAIDKSRLELHDQFLGRLATDLTPAQVEVVKDRMTYNKVKVTYDAYVQIVPHLTDAEKAHILELLKTAREEAIDAGSAEEKSAVFGRYKGKINNYLSQQGHDVKQAYKEWGERLRNPSAEAEPVAR